MNMDNQNEEANLQENQIGGDISQVESCDFCHNNSINLDSLSCSHKICPICLYRRFFIQNISELEGLCDSIIIKCGKCPTGFITKSLDELIDLSNKKINMTNEKKEKSTIN